MDTRQKSRRKFLKRIYNGGGPVLIASALLASCGKGNKEPSNETDIQSADPCGDLSEISEKDVALRNKLGYVKESPLPDNQCQNCNLYLPAKEGEACGGCMLFKGPVYASAYCTYWAPKA